MEIVSVMRIMRRQTLVWHRRGARSVFPSEMIGTVKVQLEWTAQYPLRRLLSWAKVWSLAHGIADDAHAGICLESRGRRNAETYSAVLFRSSARRQSLRPAGNRHQQPTPIKPLGSPLGIFDCHCVDKGSSALDIVDPKVVDLDLGELRSCLRCRARAHRSL